MLRSEPLYCSLAIYIVEMQYKCKPTSLPEQKRYAMTARLLKSLSGALHNPCPLHASLQVQALFWQRRALPGAL